MKIILKLLIGAAALILIARFIPQSMQISGSYAAVVVAIAIGITSITIRPILLLLSLPVTLITFGLFAIVIDAALLLLVDKFITDFTINGFGYALIVAFILAVIKSIANKLL